MLPTSSSKVTPDPDPPATTHTPKSASPSSIPDSATAPPLPFTGPPGEPDEWYNLLDITGSNHISRNDIVNAFVLIALYPTPNELDELVEFVGDGRPETFLAAWNETNTKKPTILSDLALDGLRKNRDGRLYSDVERPHLSFGESCKFLYLTYFAFPLNLIYGREWALRVIEQDHYDDLWKKQYMRPGQVVACMALVIILLGVWSNTSKSWTTVIMFIIVVVLLLTTQILFEVGRTDPANIANQMELKACYQSLSFVCVEGLTTNARDFLEEAVDAAAFSQTMNGVIQESHFKQETGRDHRRPSVVLAADIGAALARQHTKNKTEREKNLKVALESRVTFVAASFIAGSPLASVMFAAAREDVAPLIADVVVSTFFLIAMMVAMPKALPPLNQTVPRVLKHVELAVVRVNASLKGKERGEEVTSSAHLGIGRDLRNVHAAVRIVKVVRLYVCER
jgi:hypothetical protein